MVRQFERAEYEMVMARLAAMTHEEVAATLRRNSAIVDRYAGGCCLARTPCSPIASAHCSCMVSAHASAMHSLKRCLRAQSRCHQTASACLTTDVSA